MICFVFFKQNHKKIANKLEVIKIMRLKYLHKTHYRMNDSIKSTFIKIHIFIKLINQYN